MNASVIRNAVSSWWFVTGGAVFSFLFLRPAIEGWALPQIAGDFTTGSVAAVLVGLLGAPYYNVTQLRSSTDYKLVRGVTPGFHAIACAISAAACFGLVAVSDAPTPLHGLLPQAGAVLAIAFIAYAYVRRIRQTVFSRVLTVEDPDDAIELVEHCSSALEDESLGDAQRAPLLLSLSGALIAISAHADQEDLLPEALEALEDAYEAAPPAYALTIGTQFARALETKWLRTGERTGIDEALDVMMELAVEAQQEDADALG